MLKCTVHCIVRYIDSVLFSLSLVRMKVRDSDAATNWNSDNARGKMVASLRGNVGTGTKEDESRTWRVWAVGFHHVKVRSRLARVFKFMNRLFL
jgi:hypothetical protein